MFNQFLESESVCGKVKMQQRDEPLKPNAFSGGSHKKSKDSVQKK